jgi:uncharacterized protein YbaP (TraB family)
MTQRLRKHGPLKKALKVALITLGLLSSDAFAESSVWKVSRGAHTLYLGGTCHLLRPGDYPLPSEFEQAYQAADTLVFEVAPDELQDAAFAMQMMAASHYQDGRTLKSVLNEATYQALAQECSMANMPIEMIQGMKPNMAVMILTLQKLMQAGVSQEGVDTHYAEMAKQDSKPIRALETAQFQLNLITTLGEGIENEFVNYSLRDLDKISELFDEIITSWRSGDLTAINRLFIEDMAAYPDIYNTMLKERNKRWLPQIESMLSSAPSELVLVGVAHMAGKDGLIQMLVQQGYTVTQLD